MATNPGYFSEIPYLRAFAALAVICIHVSELGYAEITSINFLTFFYMSIDTFSQFAVPLFVCISGFVLYNGYKWPFSLKLFYKKRFKSVVPQYTIFSIVAILSSYILNLHSGKIWNLGATDIIYMYLTGSNLGHLWFFVLIIQLYILYPVIEKIFTKSVENAKTPQLLIFLIIVQILYHFFSIGEIFLMGTATLFLAYLFYFVLGMYVRFHYLNYKNKVTIVQMHPNGVFSALVCATILGIGNRYIQYFSRDFLPQVILINDWIDAIVTPLFYIIIFTVFVFTALKISEMTPNYITKSLRIIGNYSMGIYLIHTFIQHALVLGLYQKIGFDINNWLFFPVDFTLVLSLSLAFVYIMNKVPYHEYIIGSSR